MRYREAMTATVLFSLLTVLCWRQLFFLDRVPVNGNVLRETYPNWCVTHAFLRAGRLPLWNPYRDMGEPHLADPKTMAGYPVSWLMAGFSRFLSFLKGWIYLHTLLAGLFAGLLCRRWFGDTPGAYVCATVAAFNGFVTAHTPYINLFASAAYLP